MAGKGGVYFFKRIVRGKQIVFISEERKINGIVQRGPVFVQQGACHTQTVVKPGFVLCSPKYIFINLQVIFSQHEGIDLIDERTDWVFLIELAHSFSARKRPGAATGTSATHIKDSLFA